ncbi:MAG: hypothetical protein R2854_29700 [Caldilineaceae bacterium]
MRSTDLELAEDTEPESWGHQVIGMRFGPLAIPPGSITHAEVTFTAVPADRPNINDGPTALTVTGQADAAPAAFAEARSDISGRTAPPQRWRGHPTRGRPGQPTPRPI